MSRESREQRRAERQERKQKKRAERRPGKGNQMIVGIFLLLIGGVYLAKEVGADFPSWFFTWPMILIIVGLFAGISGRFRDLGWLIILSIGMFFLADEIWPNFPVKNFILPASIILVGLIVIFFPRHKVGTAHWWKHHPNGYRDGDKKWWEYQGPFVNVNAGVETDPNPTTANPQAENLSTENINTSTVQQVPPSFEEVLDVVAVFGAVNKHVVSKSFKGGDIVSVFGGSQINLSQADFNRQIEIESVQIFGGTTLIVPPNWQVRSEAVAIFGGIDDKREQISNTPDKVLVLKGFTMFGGIEIKSY